MAPRSLIYWRLTLALGLALLVGIPLGMPLVDLANHHAGWRAWWEWDRLLSLAFTSLRLVGGTLVLAVPAGTLAAILLYRTDLPCRGFPRFITILTLFVPLPLVASAWQATLGSGGWLPVGLWTGWEWKPWSQGMGAAIWVHAVAGLPWVILIVGHGLTWVEGELEEEALTHTGPWRVLWHVTLPRCLGSIWAAALWVALQTANEITVTDVMQVRTFAEEVYTQIVAGGEAAQAASVAVALPAMVLAWVLVAGTMRHWERRLPALDTLTAPPVLFPLGRARWPCLALVLAAMTLLAGIPLGGLFWKAGLAGSPPAWSIPTVWTHLAGNFPDRLGKVFHPNVLFDPSRWGVLAKSVALAAGAGAVTSALALVLCWLARGSRWFQGAVLGLLAAAWAIPGPVVGFGLKATLDRLLDWTGSDPAHPDWLAIWLWYGPSPVPVLWAYLLRFLPLAVALLWPVTRLIPAELRDAARVDGATPWQELVALVWPLTRATSLQAGLAVLVLALGELSASKLVETPGWETFAHDLFTRMHYGVPNDVAAQCLVLLALVVLGASALKSIDKVTAVTR